jgi:FixJ family two-component response regulator
MYYINGRTASRTAAVPETSGPIVHVVEDDSSSREATARLLRAAGYTVRTYASASEFLMSPSADGCIVLDLELPGPSGLDLQQTLVQSNDPLPVVFLSGQADVPDSVIAMKNGAVDFLTKTSDGCELLAAVERALARAREAKRWQTHVTQLRERYDHLTPREREVLAHLISGQLNKQVGFDLGISEQTTKIHRHRVLEKMQADSIPDLVRMATDLGVEPVGSVR